jgi:hypothetical protein
LFYSGWVVVESLSLLLEMQPPTTAIFWIDATSPTTIVDSLTTVAGELSKPGFDVKDVKENVRFVLAKLNTWQGRWLLVFDNFDDLHSFSSRSIKSTSRGAKKDYSRHEQGWSGERIRLHY